MTLSRDQLKQKQTQAMAAMQTAIAEGNSDAYKQAFTQYHEALIEGLKADYEQYVDTHDSSILQRRGIRQLTSKETNYYQKLINAAKSANYKQELANFTDILPETVIEDVFRELQDDHDLLNYINFVNTGFAIRWVLNDHSTQTAVWGDVTEEIAKEITSGFKTIDMTQYKLTAFFLLDMVMLELGPTWIDAYVRAILKDSLKGGVEKAVVSGTGLKQPAGADRNIADDQFNGGTGYPQKQAIKIKSFRPKEYGQVLAKLAKTEKGKSRKFKEVLLVTNMTDYLTKVMPATTAYAPDGTYIRDVFPFPTKPIVSNEIAEGKALVMLPNEYFFGVGTGKDGRIEYSDAVKFLEDQRAFKVKLYGNGKMFDNTCSVLLDISELEEFYTVVKQLESTATVGE